MLADPRDVIQLVARQIVAEAVRAGGYPPLYVDPIDFQSLYMQRMTAAGARA